MILAEKKNHMWYYIFAISPTHSEKEEKSESSYWQVSLVCVYGEQCCAGFDVSSSPVKGQKHVVEDVANEAVNLLWNLW